MTVTRTAVIPSHDTSAVKRILTYVSFALTSTTLGLPRKADFDVIYAYQGQATIGIPALRARRKYQAPAVLHVQDFWPDTVTKSGFLPSKIEAKVDRPLRWLCRQMYKRMDRTIGLSPGMTQLLIDNDANPATAQTIINWADETKFLPDEWAPAPQSDTCNVVFAGNIGPFQRVDIAIRAAVQIAQQAPNFHLDIIGRGPDEDRCRAIASELKAENVTFHGLKPYDEMPALNHTSDVLLVSLDDHEFFNGIVPSKVQVGLAAGRPMVGALLGDARNLLDASGGAITCARRCRCVGRGLSRCRESRARAAGRNGPSGSSVLHRRTLVCRGSQCARSGAGQSARGLPISVTYR
ncbi:MAG: glycosyltransferase family 4 protein [Acidimicrobiales bacterium]